MQDVPELSSLLSSVKSFTDFSLNVKFPQSIVDFSQFNSRNWTRRCKSFGGSLIVRKEASVPFLGRKGSIPNRSKNCRAKGAAVIPGYPVDTRVYICITVLVI